MRGATGAGAAPPDAVDMPKVPRRASSRNRSISRTSIRNGGGAPRDCVICEPPKAKGARDRDAIDVLLGCPLRRAVQMVELTIPARRRLRRRTPIRLEL